MAYSKYTWVSGSSPVNATNMNHIEQGIYDTDSSTYKKGDFAVLIGSITLPDAGSGSLQGNTTINYPTGFTKSNCVIISLMAQRQDTQGGFATTYQSNSSSYATGTSDLRAILKEDNIQISENKSNDSLATKTIDIKLVLLKYL